MKLGTASFLVAVIAIFSIGVEVEAAAGDTPSGLNPISYPLGGNVDAGSPVTITWQPSTPGTVTIHALKGNPDNLNDLGPIVANIANSGSFVWNVPKTFEDSSTMGAGNKYGLKIIDDATGKFEYSPPFDMTVPGSTFGGAATSSKTSSGVPTTTAAKETASTSAAASATTTARTSTPVSISTSTTKGASEVRSEPTETASPTESSSAGGILGGGGGGGGGFNLEKLPDLHLIFAASGAGVAGLIVIIVIAAVWARIRSDKKKAEYYNPKSFRDRRSHLEAETPITRGHHSRLSSTSSFGDGARASEVFSLHSRSPPPPPPMPTVPPQLRNPPPALGPPLVPPGPSPPPGPHTTQIPLSPPPPISPLPTALMMMPRNPSYSADFPFPGQPCAPYAPRVYTPARANFETHAL
ncbi:Ser-Thr-rich glycosyl-phosphatidyl-inositol-anchored membrane family-domain-containing protein [Tuber borchii]|uniref:Ser-Thr-rich glycosyl-phosphatidyl-inositol-anchored membrane family-domain-containing protein n=1 Tax=Tuber borchii TaxID=42251 RepID=A0A2T7A8T2_TUBBO|nr:Ser-Thr-rich glycosyl-phosphatidyl-inositol-anchored membrane family-domain-containing protein [Tuber borchii]